MKTDEFKLTSDIKGDTFNFDVVEHDNKSNVTYEVTIIEPEGFHSFNEIERPFTMVYNPDTGELVFDSPQDLSDFEYLESHLSNLIMQQAD